MNYRDWVNLGTASANAEARGAGSAMAVIALVCGLIYMPFDWYHKQQRAKNTAYVYAGVYSANRTDLTYPKELSKSYQSNPSVYDDLYKGTPRFVGYAPEETPPKSNDEYFNNMYKDIDENGHVTQKELDKWDSDPFNEENQKLNIAQIRQEFPQYNDVIFDGFTYLFNREIIAYAKEFPTTYKFLVTHYKNDPKNLQKVLFHGLMDSKIRRNLSGEYSDDKVFDTEMKWSNGLNLWFHY
jgi:hypothetical protein